MIGIDDIRHPFKTLTPEEAQSKQELWEALRRDDRHIHDRTMPVFVAEGYDNLFTILCKALHQAQDGKGKERHANDLPFDQQPIMAIAALTDMGFQTGQAIKKTVEAHGMVNRGQLDAAERELLGAINYLAAAVLRITKLSTDQMEKN